MIEVKKFAEAEPLVATILIHTLFQKNSNSLGEAQYQLGQINQFLGKTDSAILFYRQATATFEQNHLPERQVRALHNQARLVQSKRNYDEAAQLHFKVLKIYNENFSPAQAQKNLDLKASTLERMAVLMTNEKQYDQAEIYALEAYQLFEKVGDKGALEICCTAVGTVYFYKKQYDKAITTKKQLTSVPKLVANQGERKTTSPSF